MKIRGGWVVRGWMFACVAAIAADGCSSSAATAGGERQACYANGTCNSGLLCLNQTCVRPSSGDAGGAGGNAGNGVGGGNPGGTGGAPPVDGGQAGANGGVGGGQAGANGGGTGGVGGGKVDASSSDGASRPCPDELGAYTVTVAGAGCGDLAAGAPQCIQAGAASCQVQLASQGATGSALNGTVNLDMSGNFASGAVKEGSVQRSGCTGAWNAAASQLTVDCGGVGSSQSCIATLVRTGSSCP